MVVNIKDGQGSLGSLLVRDDFYLRLSSLMSKGEVILNDVNHYGLLFHLDKGWQRLRARRLNLLTTLRDPQEFRNYFNDEIDKNYYITRARHHGDRKDLRQLLVLGPVARS